MTKPHTPGPWALNIDTVHIRKGVNVQPVTHHMDSVGMADARLIAAAPDLLDALQKCLQYGGLYPDLADEVRTIIAKAQGE